MILKNFTAETLHNLDSITLGRSGNRGLDCQLACRPYVHVLCAVEEEETEQRRPHVYETTEDKDEDKARTTRDKGTRPVVEHSHETVSDGGQPDGGRTVPLVLRREGGSSRRGSYTFLR